MTGAIVLYIVQNSLKSSTVKLAGSSVTAYCCSLSVYFGLLLGLVPTLLFPYSGRRICSRFGRIACSLVFVSMK